MFQGAINWAPWCRKAPVSRTASCTFQAVVLVVDRCCFSSLVLKDGIGKYTCVYVCVFLQLQTRWSTVTVFFFPAVFFLLQNMFSSEYLMNKLYICHGIYHCNINVPLKPHEPHSILNGIELKMFLCNAINYIKI